MTASSYPGPGTDVMLTDIVDAIRDKIWEPLFDVLQYDTGQEFVTALGNQAFVPFFVQIPNNPELTNLQAQGKVPFDMALDGVELHIASDDIYHDVANGHLYTVKQILREHGRLIGWANGNYRLFNDKAWKFPAAAGFNTAMSQTQNATTLYAQSNGVPGVGNYFRPGGPDPKMGVILPANTTIRAELHLDALGMAMLGVMYPADQPPAEVSALGVQLTIEFEGWQARKYQP